MGVVEYVRDLSRSKYDINGGESLQEREEDVDDGGDDDDDDDIDVDNTMVVMIVMTLC